MFSEATGKDAWLLSRRGKFTASESWKLLTAAKGELFSKGALTYIEEKAIEICTNIYEQPKLDNLDNFLHGKRYEYPAYEFYIEQTRDHNMRYLGVENPVFLTYGKDAGGSPDCIKGNGLKVLSGLEIKCPKNPKTHWLYQTKLSDGWDLKDRVFPHYVQCQVLMMATESPVWHWISFDERYKVKRKRGKLIEVKAEKIFQDRMEIIFMQAAAERDKMIDKFLNS